MGSSGVPRPVQGRTARTGEASLARLAGRQGSEGRASPSFTFQTLRQSRPPLIQPSQSLAWPGRHVTSGRLIYVRNVGARTQAQQRRPLVCDGPPLPPDSANRRPYLCSDQWQESTEGAWRRHHWAGRSVRQITWPGRLLRGGWAGVGANLEGHAAGSSLRLRRSGMQNLAELLWRRVLRKRWVLALVFGLSLVYFLCSTFKQVSKRARDLCPSDPSSSSSPPPPHLSVLSQISVLPQISVLLQISSLFPILL